METIRAAMTCRLLGEASGPLAGIYVITHRASGKRYVGQSRDIASRWAAHCKGDGHSPKLAAALKKYGPDAFDWEIVELCTEEELATGNRTTSMRWGSIQVIRTATTSGWAVSG